MVERFLLFLDINECKDGSMKCPTNRMCFNQRGSATCIDTPCPPAYTRAEGGLVVAYVNLLIKSRIWFEECSNSLPGLYNKAYFASLKPL